MSRDGCVALPRGVIVVFPDHTNYFNRTICKQTVNILIRYRIMQRPIWVCIIYIILCRLQRTPGLYELKIFFSVSF